MMIRRLGLIASLLMTFATALHAADDKKIFRFPLSENPPTLDPVQIQDVTSDGVARKIFNGLVRFDQQMKPAPDLAEAVPEWNAADNSYTFKLRKGVKFHNGRELKAADDLAATAQRIADELHRQYVLGFSPQTLDDKVHRIDVKVRKPGLIVRARRSFLASSHDK